MKIIDKLLNKYYKHLTDIDCESQEENHELNENSVVKIKNLTQYREELKKGTTEFDFSELDTTFEDIQNLNLENLNLNIDLDKIFIPYDGRGKIGNNIILPVFGPRYGDYILHLENSRLSGNNIVGSLKKYVSNHSKFPVYPWYKEETFDDNYKSKYPEFFLSKDAPEELRKKYYNPKKVVKNVVNIGAVLSGCDEKYMEVEVLQRQTLTLEEYLKYYKFLNGKYLDNFEISEQDLIQIKLIEKYGLDQRKMMIENIDVMLDNVNKSVDYESYTIEEADEKGFTLTLKLKYKNNNK